MKTLVTSAFAVLTALVTGSGGTALAADGGTAAAERGLVFAGEFAPVTEGPVPRAVTYRPELVPAGSTVEVVQRVGEGRMRIALRVEGVNAAHTYGAHVHTSPCGAAPEDSGPHYQNRPGEAPEAANPSNEVWLDFTADANGAGEARAAQNWVFRADEARSVVIHEHATDSGHHGGTPGDAGARVACFTVPFHGVLQTGTAEADTLPAPPLPAPPPPGAVDTTRPSDAVPAPGQSHRPAVPLDRLPLVGALFAPAG
ncbi:superoxide dismutase family protein [Streptomyces profundus]|uniref:superoxide dismutase family protein n=1 Tax=Streptomyces profundus TaxID=2867410 RepID=UPI001D16BD6D|nr:superoxide dismutase family protein [Streptomyces sp. MA3_2.13]UED86691.1 superoxide dismutase family protein [Streptomyces sp. MA3_2.13]